MWLYLRSALWGSGLFPRDDDLPGCHPPLSIFPQLLLQIKPREETSVQPRSQPMNTVHSRIHVHSEFTCASSVALPLPANSQFCLRSPAWRAGWPLAPDPALSQPACIWFGAGWRYHKWVIKWIIDTQKRSWTEGAKLEKKEVFGDKKSLPKEGEAGCVCWRFY